MATTNRPDDYGGALPLLLVSIATLACVIALIGAPALFEGTVLVAVRTAALVATVAGALWCGVLIRRLAASRG